MGKKLKTEKEKKEVEFGNRLVIIQRKKEFLMNSLNGRYYLERNNMMIEQLESGEITETIDGRIKSKGYLLAELALMKMQGIECFRKAHFAKKELIEKMGLTEADVQKILDDVYTGTIIREGYDESYEHKSKAEFVDSPKN